MGENDKAISSDAAGGKSPAPLEYARPGTTPSRRHLFPIVGLLFLLAFSGLAFILASDYPRSRETSPRVRSASNLRQIGQAIRLYTEDFQGQYPNTLSDLLRKGDITSEVFIAPSDMASTSAKGATTQAAIDDLNNGAHCSYVYLGQGLNSHNAISPDVVIACEQLSVNAGAGMEVLFADGHVEWVDAAGGSAIMSQVGIGVRPVYWPIPATTMAGK